MARPAKPKAITVRPPAHPFEKELQGERPPSIETLKELFGHATRFFERQPWQKLTDSQLVCVEAEDFERCYCSAMGVMGEVIGLQAFVGDQGYQFFQRIYSGELRTVGDFYANQRSIYVHFVKAAELTKPDKDAMRALGLEFQKGSLTPIFRSIRPGYQAWYVNEEEGQALVTCLRAMVLLLDDLFPKQGEGLWPREDRFPVMIPHVQPDGSRKYDIRIGEPPRPAVMMPQLPKLDAARLDRIRQADFPVKGVMEVDHFYGGGAVGGRSERKSCIRLALAIDAETALAYPPQLDSPEVAVGEMLANVVQQAIEVGQVVPHMVKVKEREFKALLEPLAQSLGFTVKISKSLPALEFAREHLLRAMGDPGPLPR
jgi:hypothetical protein